MQLFVSFTFSMSLMVIAWLIYCRVQNPGLIDVFWGSNITMIGLINLVSREAGLLRNIALILVLCWGLRLSLFLLLTRVLKGERDPRYEAISHGWKNKKVGFLWQYLFQGFLAWIVAIPFYTLKYIDSMSFITLLSILTVLVGLVGESIADYQLLQHKRFHQGRICQTGFWQYSRHPNYFFECLVWLGFSIMGCSLGLGLISLVSITTLFSTMWFVTIPVTENESLKKRGRVYQDYQSRTACFFPWKVKA